MADCGLFGGVCDIVEGAVNSQVQQAAKDFLDGANALFDQFYTSWVRDAPQPVLGGGVGDWVESVTGPLMWIILTLGLIVGGAVTMYQVHAEPAKEAMVKFLRAVLIQAVGTSLIVVAAAGSTAFAGWILAMANQKTTPKDLIGTMEQFAGNYTLALLFGGITAIMVAIQWGIVIFRSVALTVLPAFWPLAAALGMFKKLESTWDRVTAWIIAFILYSPIAATLYGLALVLKSGTNGLQGVIFGLIILALAIALMPALIKLCMPIAAAVGGASAAGVAWSAGKTVVLAAAATGAVVATGGAAAPVAGGAAAGGGVAAGGGTAAATGASAAGGAGATAAAGEGAVAAGGAAGAAGAAGASGTGTAGASGAAGASGTGTAGAPGTTGATGAAGAPGGSSPVDGGASGARGGNGAELADFLNRVDDRGSVESTFIDEQYRG